MKSIIVTAADEAYMPLLQGLLSSLRQWDAPLADAIGVLDVGLSKESAAAIRSLGILVVSPDWDLAIDAHRRAASPHLRAFSARPYLPKYFPGYDVLLWIDADAWVQERQTISLFLKAARTGAMGVCLHIHQSYVHPLRSRAWRRSRLASYFGDDALVNFDSNPYVNSGAFSLRADAEHWALWQAWARAGFGACPDLVCDQTALNYALWTHSLPIHPLPALYNWCCHLALPSFNTDLGKWCEPHLPRRPIGLVHLTDNTKDLTFDVEHGGGLQPISLRFGGADALAPVW